LKTGHDEECLQKKGFEFWAVRGDVGPQVKKNPGDLRSEKILSSHPTGRKSRLSAHNRGARAGPATKKKKSVKRI